MSKVDRFLKTYAIPNEQNTTRYVWKHELPDDLNWGNNGMGDYRDDSCKYVVEKIYRNGFVFRNGKKRIIKNRPLKLNIPDCIKNKYRSNAVVAIRFCGIKEVANRSIPLEVRNALSTMPCVHCNTTTNIEIDHKCATRSVETRGYGVHAVTVDDFQPLCKKCNCLKRALYKKAEKTKSRTPLAHPDVEYGAPAFMQGSDVLENIDNPDWDLGCYWRDIVAFKKWMYSTR